MDIDRSELRWGVEQRLEFIEFRLFWEGHVNRSDLMDQFGVSVNQASTDLNRYIGFAPAKDPQIAVAIILEQAGKSGGSVAAPIARDIIVYALNNIDFNEVHDLPESDDD